MKLAEVFSRDGMSFLASCQNLVPRPWVIDDLDTFKVKWSKKPWKKVSFSFFFCTSTHLIPYPSLLMGQGTACASDLLTELFFFLCQAVIFVDNSGADIILGILPFARELLRRGTQVGLHVESGFFYGMSMNHTFEGANVFCRVAFMVCLWHVENIMVSQL